MNATRPRVVRIRKASEVFARAARDPSPILDRLVELDIAFHEAIAEASRSDSPGPAERLEPPPRGVASRVARSTRTSASLERGACGYRSCYQRWRPPRCEVCDDLHPSRTSLPDDLARGPRGCVGTKWEFAPRMPDQGGADAGRHGRDVEGRSLEQKRSPAAITEAMIEHAEARPDALHVILHEIPHENWGEERRARRRSGRLLTLERIDPSRAALIVIDMQNAFCHPEGTLGSSGVKNQRVSSHHSGDPRARDGGGAAFPFCGPSKNTSLWMNGARERCSSRTRRNESASLRWLGHGTRNSWKSSSRSRPCLRT